MNVSSTCNNYEWCDTTMAMQSKSKTKTKNTSCISMNGNGNGCYKGKIKDVGVCMKDKERNMFTAITSAVQNNYNNNR